jgi:hypothetical protein
MNVYCSYKEMMSLVELDQRRHPNNPKTHPPQQIRLFAKILEKQGWRRPIVISKRSGKIVAGHGALEAARLAEFEEAPIDWQDFPSDEAEVAHMLADNELAALGERDKALIKDLLGELEKKNFDLELTGILEAMKCPTELKPVEYVKPPKMTYVLIAIPTVKFGEINAAVEKIAAMPETIVETTVCNK